MKKNLKFNLWFYLMVVNFIVIAALAINSIGTTSKAIPFTIESAVSVISILAAYFFISFMAGKNWK